MNYPAVLLVSVALGIDAFSVAIGIGLTGVRKIQMIMVAGIITIFHIFMPLLGLSLGTYLGRVAGPMAGTIGALVLIAIGLSTLWNNIPGLGNNGPAQCHGKLPPRRKNGVMLDISSPASLVLLAAGVSLDALTVGFGLGALKVDLLLTVITMGLVAGLMTAAGLIFGRGLNRTFGQKAEIIGGLILILIGLKLLLL